MAGEWPTQPLEEVAELSGGFAFKSEDYSPDGRFVLRTLNIKEDGSIHRDDAVFLPLEKTELYKRFELQEHDTLFVMVGATLGKVGYVRREALPALLNQNMWRIRGREGLCDKRYLQYAFRHTVVKNLGWASGSARDFVRRDDYRTMEIPVPPLAEQKTIAAVLGALDDKIELNRRMNATLEAMARALFQSWFVDFDPVHAKAAGRQPTGMDPTTAALFPDSFQESELGDIPKGWEIGRLDDLLELQRGFDLPASNRKLGKYPVMAASGINGFHDAFMALGPGVTTGRSGVLGKVFFVHSDYWPLNTSLWVRTFKKASPTYVFHLLQDLDLGSFNAGSAVPTLNRNHVHDLRILIPPRSIIESFDRVAIPLMKTKKNYEDQSCALASLRDTLLPKLLNGELSASKYLSDIEGV